jgi:hypothetical protein
VPRKRHIRAHDEPVVLPPGGRAGSGGGLRRKRPIRAHDEAIAFGAPGGRAGSGGGIRRKRPIRASDEAFAFARGLSGAGPTIMTTSNLFQSASKVSRLFSNMGAPKVVLHGDMVYRRRMKKPSILFQKEVARAGHR